MANLDELFGCFDADADDRVTSNPVVSEVVAGPAAGDTIVTDVTSSATEAENEIKYV